jgi:uncharacterized protein (TIGR02145 family)
MKKLLYLVCFVAMMGFMACSSDDEPTVKPDATGTMNDKDGNEYKWVRIGGLDWMAENLKCGDPFYEWTMEDDWGDEMNVVSLDNWPLDKAKTEYELFGNYYTYEQAVADAPDGWRLPTDEDWKKLEVALGMSQSNADALGFRNGAADLAVQTADEGTGLNLRYGGALKHSGYGYDWSVAPYHVYDYGIYWTATIDTTQVEKAAFFRKITPARNMVERNSSALAYTYYSVRYVRDAQ